MNKEENMNLTLKQICNYIAVMNKLVEKGIIKFDKDKAYVEFNANGCIDYLEKQNIELQQKVNQLETNRDEAIKELEILRNRLLYEEDFCMEEVHIDEAKAILERGKE